MVYKRPLFTCASLVLYVCTPTATIDKKYVCINMFVLSNLVYARNLVEIRKTYHKYLS